MNKEIDYQLLSKNLADVLYDLRKMIDDGDNISTWNKVMPSVDAALEQYEDLTVQEMELEREGLLDIVTYNKKVYYRIKYTNPYKYCIWWHRVKEDTTSLLKMVEDDKMVKKLEVAFNNDIENIRNFEKCKKIVDEWKKPQEPEEENDKNPPLVLRFELGRSLEGLIEEWWEDIFTVNSTDDSQTSIQDLVDRIEKWLPSYLQRQEIETQQHFDKVVGYNDCLKQIKSKLRNKE